MTTATEMTVEAEVKQIFLAAGLSIQVAALPLGAAIEVEAVIAR